jgi:hypothetical protein
MDKKVHIDPLVSRYILPIGCTVNMNGTAMFVAVATFFIAQMNDLQLSLGDIITVWYVECCVIMPPLISNTPLIIGKKYKSVLGEVCHFLHYCYKTTLMAVIHCFASGLMHAQGQITDIL